MSLNTKSQNLSQKEAVDLSEQTQNRQTASFKNQLPSNRTSGDRSLYSPSLSPDILNRR